MLIKNKIVYMIALLILTVVGIRIYEVNSQYSHKIVRFKCNDNITYNKTLLKVNDISLLSAEEFFDYYNISSDKSNKEYDNYGQDFSYLTYNIYLTNETLVPCYFDFEHFVLEMGDWFSWMNRDMFIEINKQMNNNYRVCIYPGIETNIVVPFLIYYGPENDNFMFKELTEGKATLNLGVYPERYTLTTLIKNFSIENEVH